MNVSVVVPVLDDAPALASLLARLSDSGCECVVVDGGSTDGSREAARAARARVFEVIPASRGAQLDAGWRRAREQWIWFLHADNLPSPEVIARMRRIARGRPVWGRYDVRLVDPAGKGDAPAWQRMVGGAMNLRSALTGICTGDQGIFVHTALLEAVGGVPAQPLMEDIELCRRLRRLAHPLRCREPLASDARRWRRRGVLRTIVSMWWFRLRYFLGADPRQLAREYYGTTGGG